MTAGNHVIVSVTIGTLKAMRNIARRIPRRWPPPATAHVLMVKMTVAPRSVAAERKNLDVIVNLPSARHVDSSIMPGQTLMIRISHGMFD